MKRVGILGAGQLGRMLAQAGQNLELEVHLFDIAPDACGGQVAPLTVASFDDLQAVQQFARTVDVITYEFENIPVRTVQALEDAGFLVRPSSASLKVAQDRAEEKQLFHRIGLPTPAYACVNSEEELQQALLSVGLPAVLKTRREGYDGKGQCVIQQAHDALAAWQSLGRKPCVLEAFVRFRREISVLVARGHDGTLQSFAPTENVHKGGILHTSIAPAAQADHARKWGEQLAEEVGHVGMLALELFETPEGDLLCNEWAPRVHNSGHWTLDAGSVSQFEQHMRAVVGLPLAHATLKGSVLMLNLVGTLPPKELFEPVGGKWHEYGKPPRAGRKLGHVNFVGDSIEQVKELVAQVTASV